MEPSSLDSTIIDQNDVHLIWVGRFDKYDRPEFHYKGKYVLAKKLIYESWYGPIEDDQIVISQCRNNKCVKPDHLRASQYFYQKTRARNGRRHPVHRRRRWIIDVNEKLMLKVFNGIKCGRLNSIAEIGEFMNVDDCDVIEFISNNNWMFLNKYYSKEDLDQLRAKVIPKAITDCDKQLITRRLCNEYFKSW
jgi:hypothetical protein